MRILPESGTNTGFQESSPGEFNSLRIYVKAVDPLKKMLLLSSGQFPHTAGKIARTTRKAGNAS